MKKQKQDFSVLKKADSRTVEQISEICPVLNQNEQKRIFARSQAKYRHYQKAAEPYADEEIFQAEPVKTSGIFMNFGAAAACFLVCAGTVGGGVYLLKHRQNTPVQQSAEQLASETENTSASETTIPETSAQYEYEIEETCSPTESFNFETNSPGIPETTAQNQTKETQTETAVRTSSTAVSETTRSTTTALQTAATELRQTTTQPPETSAEVTQANEIITFSAPETTVQTTVITETETVPEITTEPTEPEEPEEPENITALFQKLEFDENGCIHLPDFKIQTNLYEFGGRNYSVLPEQHPNPKHKLETVYIPSYFPDVFTEYNQVNEAYRQVFWALKDVPMQYESARSGKYYINDYFAFDYCTETGYSGSFQQNSILFDVFSQDTDEYIESLPLDKFNLAVKEFYSCPLNGKTALLAGNVWSDWGWLNQTYGEKAGVVSYCIIWEQDGYFFRLEGMTAMDESGDFLTSLEKSESFAEFLKMAESVAPADIEGKTIEDFPVETEYQGDTELCILE